MNLASFLCVQVRTWKPSVIYREVEMDFFSLSLILNPISVTLAMWLAGSGLFHYVVPGSCFRGQYECWNKEQGRVHAMLLHNLKVGKRRETSLGT